MRRPRLDPEKSLFDDATKKARELKRRHRALYDRDPIRFRALVKKANGRVFRLRPGPKADARIAQAARERASGCSWLELYSRFIDGHATMPEFTRALAEDSFRRKVNQKLRPRYRSRSRKRTGRGKPRRKISRQ
jgi:hypothetical protein